MGLCERCVFYARYQDMGASCGTCTLQGDLSRAIERYDIFKDSLSCPYAVLHCDLIDALSLSGPFPFNSHDTYAYKWSSELRAKSLCKPIISIILNRKDI